MAMLFLIDENLPRSIGSIFADLGFRVEYVKRLKQLRGQPDEVIFEYAISHEAVIVTRDLNFANPLRFELPELAGMVVLRFPNEISIAGISQEVKRLAAAFKYEDWRNLIILEPGSARLRKLH